MFDNFDEVGLSDFTFHSNIDRHLNAESSIMLESYLNMFKATDDLRYLNKFCILAKRIQDRRDDNIGTAVVTDLPNYYSFNKPSGALIRTCTITSPLDISSSKAWSVWDGNNISEMITQLVKKQEELILYIIQLNKRIESLENK
ncbi:MAG: hypothetical protein H0X46_07165 [Bacteroidetes bacterium]|nr:hypothetical protein [Bacteroidota bacterium]